MFYRPSFICHLQRQFCELYGRSNLIVFILQIGRTYVAPPRVQKECVVDSEPDHIAVLSPSSSVPSRPWNVPPAAWEVTSGTFLPLPERWLLERSCRCLRGDFWNVPAAAWEVTSLTASMHYFMSRFLTSNLLLRINRPILSRSKVSTHSPYIHLNLKYLKQKACQQNRSTN